QLRRARRTAASRLSPGAGVRRGQRPDGGASLRQRNPPQATLSRISRPLLRVRCLLSQRPVAVADERLDARPLAGGPAGRTAVLAALPGAVHRFADDAALALPVLSALLTPGRQPAAEHGGAAGAGRHLARAHLGHGTGKRRVEYGVGDRDEADLAGRKLHGRDGERMAILDVLGPH